MVQMWEKKSKRRKKKWFQVAFWVLLGLLTTWWVLVNYIMIRDLDKILEQHRMLRELTEH